MTPRRSNVLLLGLLASALALRLAWALAQPAAPDERLGDQAEYLALARNLLHAGDYRFFDPRFGQDVYAYRTPGYALFVAALGASPRAVRVAQAVLDASTVLAIFCLARRLLRGGRGADAGALLAGAAVAFNPFLIYFTGLVLSETLFTALLAWGMCLLIRDAPSASPSRGRAQRSGAPPRIASPSGDAAVPRQTSPSETPATPLPSEPIPVRIAPAQSPSPQAALLPWPVFAGLILLALSVQVRPSAIALAILLALASAWGLGWRGAVARGGLAALAVVALLFPWALRNARHPHLQAWIWTTTNGGITSYDGFHDGATGASDQGPFLEQILPVLKDMGEIERDRYLRQRARQWAAAHPARSAELAVVKIARTWSPVPLSNEYGQNRAYLAAALAFTLPFDLLVLVGLWAAPPGRAAKLFLFVPALYFTALHALSVGSLRYRIPCEPPMGVLAGSGAAAVLVSRSGRGNPGSREDPARADGASGGYHG